jgi:hypothetical protein
MSLRYLIRLRISNQFVGSLGATRIRNLSLLSNGNKFLQCRNNQLFNLTSFRLKYDKTGKYNKKEQEEPNVSYQINITIVRNDII